MREPDLLPLLVTFLVGLLWRLEYGILLGTGVSLLLLLHRSARPKIVVTTKWTPAGGRPYLLVTPECGLHYPAAENLRDRILAAARGSFPAPDRPAEGEAAVSCAPEVTRLCPADTGRARVTEGEVKVTRLAGEGAGDGWTALDSEANGLSDGHAGEDSKTEETSLPVVLNCRNIRYTDFTAAKSVAAAGRSLEQTGAGPLLLLEAKPSVLAVWTAVDPEAFFICCSEAAAAQRVDDEARSRFADEGGNQKPVSGVRFSPHQGQVADLADGSETLLEPSRHTLVRESHPNHSIENA
ncbi:uncharacterized protein LOC119095050 [Pollicipes pollicipes]|uniref:uncharacterized protein LOC119095050 n=1 Tax=Pollicipes pollicipes TaxID=41117 RepID=UPI001884EA08|nr:uncharacterized protein LOC119095050 [Pollicipes pollicipes]